MGNLTSYNDAGGTVTYGYNEVNLLTSLTEPSGAKTTYNYDNANRRISMTLPSSTGITVSYGYDNAGHTLSIKALRGTTQILYLTYAYTKTLKTHATYNDDTSLNYIYGYSYDALNRLTGASGLRGTSTSYGYDGAGNRTSSVSHGITTTYSYNAADELVSSLTNGTTTNYTYDGNGNQLTGAGRTFSINEKNQITSVTTGSSTDSYTYSGLDQTDRVQVNGASAIYSSLGLSVDGAGSASATYHTRTNQGQLVNERTTSVTYYYLMDDLGSVLKVVDSSGTVKNSYSYNPYGLSLNKNETVTNPWQYASGYFDANTGLYKFGTRYYDSQTGRWTQKDPQPSSNPYVYAGDEPTMQVDPSGKVPAYCTLSIVGTALITVGTAIAAIQAIGTLGSLSAAITAAENPLVIDAASAAVAAYGSALTAAIGIGFVLVGTIIVLIALAAYLCGDVKS